MPSQTSILILILLISKSHQLGKIQIKFSENSSRPIRDPDELLLGLRRSFWAPQNSLCYTVGSSAGALLGHRIASISVLTEEEKIPGHILLNLQTFIKILSVQIAHPIAKAVKCPATLISAATEEMSTQILCSVNRDKMLKEHCLAQAFEKNGVLKFLPEFEQILPIEKDGICEGKKFNVRVPGGNDFFKHLEKYFKTFIDGLQNEVLDLHKKLQVANLKPLDLPFPGTDSSQIYVEIAVHAAVLATHISKKLVETGELTRTPKKGSFEIITFISYLVKNIVLELNLKSEEFTNRCHTTALKMIIFWFINNKHILKNTSAENLSRQSLISVGLGNYYTTNLKDPLNLEHVGYSNLYIHFGKIKSFNEASLDLQNDFDMVQIKSEIQQLMPTEDISISDELIKFELLPIPEKPISSLILDSTNQNFSVGSLPKPEKWFSADINSLQSSDDLNGVFIATLAVIIGSHVGTIMPEMGLITQEHQPGFNGMKTIDIYEIMQDITELFVKQLMSTIPLSLNEGFYVLNAAFKTAKLTLNMEKPPNTVPIKTLISLGIKYAEIIEFYPELKSNQIELLPLPKKLNTLMLWVKPILNVNLEEAMQEKMKKLTQNKFPDVLNELISIMKPNIPDLTFYNLRNLRSKLSNAFPWDPAKVLSFLFDPPSKDGEEKMPENFIEPMKSFLACPGHFLCPSTMCMPPTCGSFLCVSSDPWCYMPTGINCPGSIHCPIRVPGLGKFKSCPEDDVNCSAEVLQSLTCPGDEECPVNNIECPGRSECPNNDIKCPGDSSCPLQINCPGVLCPNRFVDRPQVMLPCPQHPDCGKQQPDYVLLCTDHASCRYAAQPADIVGAIENAAQMITQAIDRKQVDVIVNTSAISNVYLGEQIMTKAESGSAVNNTESTADASAAAVAES